MESPQSVVSPFKNSSVYSEPENQNLDLFTRNPSFKSTESESESKPILGVLDVCIHQARDIQNICIYHKQDVYAKVCLTSNPEKAVTTNTVNGGGKNPVFNETLQVNIPTIDCSLKCEIYMLSRVRNYLEDQLLGFALIPLSEILIKNGKLEKEFCLSSTDLFHSPAGFVHLSLSYNGVSPDVIAVPSPKTIDPVDSVDSDESDPSEFEKIEFPDPKIANENHMMVSEYIELSSESGQVGAPFGSNPVEPTKPDSPPASVSTNGSQCASGPFSASSESANQEYDSPEKDKHAGDGAVGSDISGGVPVKNSVAAVIEPDQKVVQQDFVDLYMKSMMQFTESLAKMKLPLDVERERADSGNSSSDQKIQTPNKVFYGSRAFF